jgi:MFS family permease
MLLRPTSRAPASTALPAFCPTPASVSWLEKPLRVGSLDLGKRAASASGGHRVLILAIANTHRSYRAPKPSAIRSFVNFQAITPARPRWAKNHPIACQPLMPEEARCSSPSVARQVATNLVLRVMMPQEAHFFGWKVAWTAFVIAACGAGAGLYGPSVFLPVLHATRGWSVSVISAAITTHFLPSACIVIYLRELSRRLPLATVTQLGALSCALGVITWSIAQAPWQLFVVALLTGVGWATTSSAAINAMVARWFDRDRPKALSLALNGASVGGVLFPPVWVGFIAYVGFAASGLLVAATIVAIVWPLAHHYLRTFPADLGLMQDGIGHEFAQRALSRPSRSRPALLRDPQFLTMATAFALGMFAQIGLVAHLIARLTPDIGARGAAAALSLITLCAILGRTLLGWLLRDHNRRIIAALNFFAQSVGVLLLAMGGATNCLSSVACYSA